MRWESEVIKRTGMSPTSTTTSDAGDITILVASIRCRTTPCNTGKVLELLIQLHDPALRRAGNTLRAVVDVRRRKVVGNVGARAVVDDDAIRHTSGRSERARNADRRGAELNFSPASERVRSKYERLPVVARE